jgi:hypothetical protein
MFSCLIRRPLPCQEGSHNARNWLPAVQGDVWVPAKTPPDISNWNMGTWPIVSTCMRDFQSKHSHDRRRSNRRRNRSTVGKVQGWSTMSSAASSTTYRSSVKSSTIDLRVRQTWKESQQLDILPPPRVSSVLTLQHFKSPRWSRFLRMATITSEGSPRSGLDNMDADERRDLVAADVGWLAVSLFLYSTGIHYRVGCISEIPWTKKPDNTLSSNHDIGTIGCFS